MNEEFEGEKTEDPSPHRIEEFREKGMVASSREVINLVMMIVSFVVLIYAGKYILHNLTTFIDWLYRLNHESAYTDKGFKLLVANTFFTLLKCTGPMFITTFTVGVLANVVQFGLVFAPDALQFNFSKIDPFQGLMRIFSIKSLVETGKSILKLVIIIGISYALLKRRLLDFTGYLHVDLVTAFLHSKELMWDLGIYICIGLVVVAAIDLSWEKFSYRKKLQLTKQQVKQELREREGNPEVKVRIRQIQRELAYKRMMTEVPNADVIVTNPTHISVAIQYDSLSMVAPRVIAKGSDLVALRIREIAKSHDIPLVENRPLARTLYKTVKVGEGIPRDLYKAIAEILAFVYKFKRKRNLKVK